jgi:MFS family permease
VSTSAATVAPTAAPARPWLYYGWVNLAVATAAMTATLPGRTHGLGLIQQPLTAELGISEVLFGRLNFWAVVLGAALCLPVGRAIDRFGARAVLVAAAASLGVVVLNTTLMTGVWVLFVLLILTRGLGQGSLSVVSMALVGKWFTRRLGPAMGVYTVLLAFGFIAVTLGTGEAVKAHGWRAAWAGVGFALLLGVAPLGAALRWPAFWAYTLSASLLNAVFSAVTLFNANLLKDRGLGEDTYTLVLAVLTVSGLPVNLLAGWAARHWPIFYAAAPLAVLFGAAARVARPPARATPGG